MKKNNLGLTILIVIASTFLIASSGINIYLLNKADNTPYEFISSYSLIATSIFAIYYMVSGCNKEEGAAYFKIFMVLEAINQLVSIYDLANYSKLGVILSAIAGVLMLALAIVLNLGITRSLIIAYGTLACLLIKTVYLMKSLNLSLGLPSLKLLTALLISLVAVVMVYAKYNDKFKRGSK